MYTVALPAFKKGNSKSQMYLIRYQFRYLFSWNIEYSFDSAQSESLCCDLRWWYWELTSDAVLTTTERAVVSLHLQTNKLDVVGTNEYDESKI